MSKGSSPRPFEVDHDTYTKNFEAIFGKKKQEEKPSCNTGYCYCTECIKEKPNERDV